MTKSKQTADHRKAKAPTPRKRVPSITPEVASGAVTDAIPVTSIDAAPDIVPEAPDAATADASYATPLIASLPAKTTKLERLITLLQRPEGASLAELCATTGWQAHSVRGALAGTLKHKGHAVTSEKADSVRRYRIAAPV